MKLTPILALSLPLLAAGPALAQGTAQQRIACGPDAYRLCASEFPSIPAITACMRRERANVSPACRDAMNDAEGGAPTKVAAEPAPERRRVAEPKVIATPRAKVAEAPPLKILAQTERPKRGPAAREPLRVVDVPAKRSAGGQRIIYRYVYVRTPAARNASVRAASSARSFAGMGRRGGSQMAQAMYWMNRVNQMSGGMGGMGNMAGMSRMSMGGMNLSSVMSMIPY